MTTIYLIRHAQAAGNVGHVFQGHVNSNLSPLGYAQLEYLARRGQELHPDIVYSSPLKRAAETAKAVNRFVGAPLLLEQGLLEIDGGRWEGKGWDVFQKEDPVMARHFFESPGYFQAPGGEAMSHVYHRVVQCFQQIVKSNRNKTICIVSHGCALGTLITWRDHRPVEQMRCEDLSHNTGITTVTEQDGIFTLVQFDDLSHLPKQMQTGFSRKKPEQGR